MKDFVSTVRPWLELLYFAAGIILALGIAFAYAQLRVLKKDLRLRNVRASREKALDACDRYFDRYVPLANAYLKERDAANLPSYSGSIGDFTKSSIAANWKQSAEARFNIFSWSDALNQLEAISASFRSEVADSETAYPIIGRSLVRAVELHYDLLALSRRESASPLYSCTVWLYNQWKPRLQMEELGKQREAVDEQLNSLPIPPKTRTVGDDA